MITLVIILVCLLFVTGIFFVPLLVVVETNTKEYYVNLYGYAKAQLVMLSDGWKIRLRILFVSFYINPFARISKPRTKVKTSKPKRKRKKPSLRKVRTFVIRFFQSLYIKKLIVTIDTNDFPFNAQLIPIAQHINQKNIKVNINFENQNSIDFMAYTRLYKIIWIAILSFLINKN
ncbi:hypothetical protein ES705_03569 [subsurface metagenome]